MARHADWYFDFISPYAYLQFKHFHKLPADLEVTLKPVLFAGLLGHWEHKGPAEIPAKRVQTYRYSHWLAKKLGVPFKTPPAHPFNPLKILRLACALDGDHAVVEAVFNFVWGTGGDVNDDAALAKLAARFGVTDLAAVIGRDEVKESLRANTEAAIARGVYGVPTFAVDEELFWGFDTTDMLLDYLANPAMMQSAEMQRLTNMPMAASRKL
ncbi:MAG: 2-hydroxychromene-2-carboxylate isomerase [Gammaproteobacteria bacterium]|nr:2-hydroxychromene-2-carboxylate isomerase [Gammaproteobacteria bacterium]